MINNLKIENLTNCFAGNGIDERSNSFQSSLTSEKISVCTFNED